ncbi:MAG: hypothetical protein AAF958_05695 [Planctomycetota bacterium]
MPGIEKQIETLSRYDLPTEKSTGGGSSLGHVPWLIRMSIAASLLLLGWSLTSPMRSGVLSDSGASVHQGVPVRNAGGGSAEFGILDTAPRNVELTPGVDTGKVPEIIAEARKADAKLLSRIRAGKVPEVPVEKLNDREDAIEYYNAYRKRVLSRIENAEARDLIVPDQYIDHLEAQLRDRP